MSREPGLLTEILLHVRNEVIQQFLADMLHDQHVSQLALLPVNVRGLGLRGTRRVADWAWEIRLSSTRCTRPKSKGIPRKT